MSADESSAARQGVMVLAIGLAVYAQFVVHGASDDSTAWMLLAAAAILAAFTAGQCHAVPAAMPTAPTQRTNRALRGGLLALAVAAIAATTYLSTNERLPFVALALWLASPVLASLGLRGWQVTPARHATAAWTRAEIALLTAIIALAALARLLWIDTLPRAYFGDEPRVGLFLSQAFHDGHAPNFFSMGWNTWPMVGLSLQGALAPLFGLHIWTLRLSSALFGTLAVLTTYVLARELFAPRTALIAAFLFAICRTAIDFSRVGITHSHVLCLEPLAFFWLWRALNGGRASAYLWAGVTTAWCLFTYNAGQLVPPLVLGWLVLGGLARPSRLRTHWRGALILVAAFALTLFPYLYYFTDAFAFGPNWGQWTIMARNRQTLSRVVDAWQTTGVAPAWSILSRQVWATWLGFGVVPGAGYTLGYRKGGMLDDVSAALFIIGLAMTIRRVRRDSDAFLLYWWLGTVVAGGIATIDPPSFVRMVGLLPALALLAAQPLDWLLSTAASAATAAQRIGVAAVAVVLLAGATWVNYRTYFVEFAASTVDPMSELRRFAEELPSDQRVELLGADHFLQFGSELFEFDFAQPARNVAETAHFLPVHEPMQQPLHVVLGPTQLTLADYLRVLYPDAEFAAHVFDVQHVFTTVRLTPEQVRPRTGLALSATLRDGSRRELGSADPFAEQVELPPDTEQLRWTGSVYWPSDRPVPVTLDASLHTSVTFGDAPALVNDGAAPIASKIVLPRGWQPVTIEEPVVRRRRLAIQLTPAGRLEPLTRWQFRPDSTHEGLAATYTPGRATAVHAIDPQLNSFAVEDCQPRGNPLLVRMPFTASWRGALRVDTPGPYAFQAIGSGRFAVRLDGQPLLGNAPNLPDEPVSAIAERQLSVGPHPIEVDFDSTVPAHTSRRILQLFWTPPGGSEQLIPPSNFVRPPE